jgi:hypothetical protein
MLDKDNTVINSLDNIIEPEVNPYRNKMSQENINNHNSFAPAFIVNNQHLLKDNPNMFIENFATRSVASLGTLGSPLPTFPEEKDYSFIETLGATFEEGSGILNAYRAFDNSMPWNTNLVFDPSFNPIQAIEEFPEDSPYRQYVSEFAYARNKYHFDSIARNIDRLTQAREVLSGSSLVNQLLAGAVMGISDPTNILFANPIGATLKTGGSLLKVAGKLGAIAGAQEALNEGILQSVQDVRTIEDTAINIGGAVVLGSVLGGLSGIALKGITKQKYDEIVQNIEKDLVVPETGVSDEFLSIVTMPLDGGSVGAMATPRTTLKQETLIGALGLEKATKFLNPALTLSQSANLKIRELTQDLITLPFILTKNKEGVATALSIEDNLKLYKAMYATISDLYDNTFVAYKQAAKGQPTLSTEQFSTRLYQALINDDVDELGNPFVTKLAKEYRKAIIDPLKRTSIKAKLLDPNVQVTTAKSYFPRVYDTSKIRLQLTKFKDVLRNNFNLQYDAYVNNVAKSRVEDFDKKSVTVRKLDVRQKQLQQLREESPEIKQQQERAKNLFKNIGDNLHDLREAQKQSEKISKELSEIKIKFRRLKPNYEKYKIKQQNKINFVAKKQKAISILEEKLNALKTAGKKNTKSAINLEKKIAIRKNNLEKSNAVLNRITERFNIKEKIYKDTFEKFSNLRREKSNIDKVNNIRIVKISIDNNDYEILERSIKKYQINLKKTSKEVKRLSAKAGRLRAKAQQRIDDNIDLYYGRGTEAEKAQYIEDSIESTVKNILGMNGLYDFSKPIAVSGVFKNRVLNIPDTDLSDFLIKDPRFILNSYIRQVAPQLELVEKFGSMDNFKQKFKDADSEHLNLLEKAKTEKERKALIKAYNKETKALNQMVELVMGTYQSSNNPDSWITKTLQTSRFTNHSTLMGGQLLASIPDIGALVAHNGLINVLGMNLKKIVTARSAVKKVIQQGRVGGASTELSLNNRVFTASEIGDPYSYGSPFSRFLSNMSTTFSRVNLSVYWNSWWQDIASALMQDRILSAARKLNKDKKVSQKDLVYLASMGLDVDTLKSMGRSFDQFGSIEDGLLIAGVTKWDANLARKYGASLNKAVDQQVVQKGFGDIPLFMNSEAGKTIMQFQSFAFAAHNRILLSGLQRADANALSGFVTIITMGMVTYYIRENLAGREVSDDPRQWVYEGLDRSGLLQVLMLPNNIMEKAGVPGISNLFGGAPVSRYASRNLLSTILGPSAGMVQSAGQLLGAATNPDIKWTASDGKSAQRFIPFQNVFYLNWLFNLAREGLSDTMGVPYKR